MAKRMARARLKLKVAGARARKAGKPWTKDEDKIIIKLVKQHVPTSHIAKTLRRTPGAIRSHASQQGFSLVAKGR